MRNQARKLDARPHTIREQVEPALAEQPAPLAAEHPLWPAAERETAASSESNCELARERSSVEDRREDLSNVARTEFEQTDQPTLLETESGARTDSTRADQPALLETERMTRAAAAERGEADEPHLPAPERAPTPESPDQDADDIGR